MMNSFIFILGMVALTIIGLTIVEGILFIATKNKKLNRQINRLEEFLLGDKA